MKSIFSINILIQYICIGVYNLFSFCLHFIHIHICICICIDRRYVLKYLQTNRKHSQRVNIIREN